MVMRVGFASADWGHDETGKPIPGGAGWARIHQVADRLTDAGHRVGIGSKMAASLEDGYLVPLGHDMRPAILSADLIVCQRWMHAAAATETRRARALGQVVIHDVDDWFWGLDPANRAHKTTSKRVNPTDNREHYARAVAAADAVTVSTPFLAKRIRERFGVPTILLRNAVDFRSFAPSPVRPVDSGLVVGWVGALAWRSGDLETLRGVLGPFLDETDSTFAHHGTFDNDTDTAAERAGVAPDRAAPCRPIVAPWQYPELLTGIDIGIVPLADVPFNRAKSWIKGLEYAAAGIPFIAARTPEYAELGCGLLASTPDEWANALRVLRDPAERAAVRAAGFDRARELDINRRWVDWEQAYTTLLR